MNPEMVFIFIAIMSISIAVNAYKGEQRTFAKLYFGMMATGIAFIYLPVSTFVGSWLITIAVVFAAIMLVVRAVHDTKQSGFFG
ncbi:MAG: hypothetical protein HOM11_09785 [Methylococcales bacterium]|nr:hypothetical protein [Methylococcales bacterium]MBT7444992.1 hypothetical protein [Methylococcales bacterium]